MTYHAHKPCGYSTRLPLPLSTQQLNWEIRRVQRQCQRAAGRKLPATLTLREWLAILSLYRWQCAFCGEPSASMEHVTPISWGGGTTKDNVLPCCQPCNALRDQVARAVVTINSVGSQRLAVADLLEVLK